MKKKISLDKVKSSKGKTDWAYLKKNDLNVFDGNARPLNEGELSQMKKPLKVK